MSVSVAVEPALPAPPQPRAVHDELEFVTAPPGLAGLRRFVLSALDDSGHLFALRSAEHPDVRLFVVPPRPYFPHYAPEIDDSTLGSLELGEHEPILLVVVHPGQDGAAPTANLLAPVAVNPVTGSALQVVLDGDEWPLRAAIGDSTAA